MINNSKNKQRNEIKGGWATAAYVISITTLVVYIVNK